MNNQWLAATTAMLAAILAPAQGGAIPAPKPPPPTAVVDPLSTGIDRADAARFAAVFAATGGRPSAQDLQTGYLSGAGRGVEIFTPHRIEDAANLAAAVAKEPERYSWAISTCLPLLASLETEMRAVYLAYAGLLPEKPLPQVHVVFGALNSGGTAVPGAQVIGLEVMCGPGTTPEAFRAGMRRIFAHETVHSWQPDPSPADYADPMAFMAIREGVPDFLAWLVTGLEPSEPRARWGISGGADVWARFQADRAIAKAAVYNDWDLTPPGREALGRWFGNAGSAPKDMPDEAGY